MLVRVLAASVALLMSSSVFAGGSCQSPSGGPSVAGSAAFNGYAVDARSDRRYRNGKLAYAKRDANGKKIKYCIVRDGEAKRVTRTRLKTLQGSSVLEFAQSLVVCDQPQQLALMQVADKNSIPNIIYYLAMNYGVNLTSVAPDERVAAVSHSPLSTSGQ